MNALRRHWPIVASSIEAVRELDLVRPHAPEPDVMVDQPVVAGTRRTVTGFLGRLAAGEFVENTALANGMACPDRRNYFPEK